MGLHHDETLGLELKERLPDGDPTHLELGGDLVLDETRSGLDLTGQDRLAQHVVDELLGRPTRPDAFGSVEFRDCCAHHVALSRLGGRRASILRVLMLVRLHEGYRTGHA
jgi:hypothetical protein